MHQDTGRMYHVPHNGEIVDGEDGHRYVVRGDTMDVVFQKGELVELKGRQFRVEAIGRRFLRLRGLPGTRCEAAGSGSTGA